MYKTEQTTTKTGTAPLVVERDNSAGWMSAILAIMLLLIVGAIILMGNANNRENIQQAITEQRQSDTQQQQDSIHQQQNATSVEQAAKLAQPQSTPTQGQPGLPGAPGATGERGATGAPGADGSDGSSPAPAPAPATP